MHPLSDVRAAVMAEGLEVAVVPLPGGREMRGVYARRSFEPGEFITVYSGVRLRRSAFEARVRRKRKDEWINKYTVQVDEDWCIVALPNEDFGGLINEARNGEVNTAVMYGVHTEYDDRSARQVMVLVAGEAGVAEGEQITWDYAGGDYGGDWAEHFDRDGDTPGEPTKQAARACVDHDELATFLEGRGVTLRAVAEHYGLPVHRGRARGWPRGEEVAIPDGRPVSADWPELWLTCNLLL